MSFKEKPPLGDKTATRLKRTHSKPSEWIGELSNGSRVHIVADNSALRIAEGEGITEALLQAVKGKVVKIKHNCLSNDVPTEVMLSATGLAVIDE